MNTRVSYPSHPLELYREASAHAIEDSFACSHLTTAPSKLRTPELHPHDHRMRQIAPEPVSALVDYWNDE